MDSHKLPQFTAGLKASTFETAQGITNYYDLGSSSNKSIVLVPGYLCSALMYKDFAEHLVSLAYRVIMYDPYGTGGSIKTSKDKYTLETMVEQLKSLITNLYLRDVIVVGYSMGGLIAATYAKENSSKVSKVILMMPAGYKVNQGPQTITMIMRTPIIGPKFMDYFYHSTIMDAIKVNFVHPEDPKFSEIIQFLYMHIYTSWCLNPSFSEAACGIFRFMNVEGHQKTLQSITKPVTVILAKNDIAIPFQDNFDFWSKVPNVSVNVLDECGHWGIHEKRDEMFEIIDKSLAV